MVNIVEKSKKSGDSGSTGKGRKHNENRVIRTRLPEWVPFEETGNERREKRAFWLGTVGRWIFMKWEE